jgi:type II secretory pathway component PulJ
MKLMNKIIFKKSFTLVELLIAVTMISVILLSLYSAFNTGILSYKKIDASFDAYQEARAIFNRIEIDLKNSFPYKKDVSLFNGTSEHLEFFTVLDIYNKDKIDTQICRIKYQFDTNTLKRTAYVAEAAIDNTTEPVPEELSAAVKSINFEYAGIDSSGKEAFTWQANWPQDNTQGNEMPLAVKAKITLVGRNEKQENLIEFSKTIPMRQENVDDSHQNTL